MTHPNTTPQRTLPINGVAERIPVAGAMPALAGSPPMARWAAVKWLAKYYPGITHPMLAAMEGVLYHSGTDKGCYASLNTLADEACVSRDTIKRGVQQCQKAGLLRAQTACDNHRTLWPVLPAECLEWLVDKRYLKADPRVTQPLARGTQHLARGTQHPHNPNPTQTEQGPEPERAAAPQGDSSNHSGGGGAATRHGGATRQSTSDDEDDWETQVDAFVAKQGLLDTHNKDFVKDWREAALKMNRRNPRSLFNHWRTYCNKRDKTDRPVISMQQPQQRGQSGPQSIDAIIGVAMPQRTPRQTVFDKSESLAELRALAEKNGDDSFTQELIATG